MTSTVSLDPMTWQRQVSPEDQERFRSNGWWRDVTALDEFLDSVARHPHKAAVVAYSKDNPIPFTVTYGQLGAMVDRCALAYLEHGVGKGDAVTIQLPNVWQFPVAVLAAMRIGALPNPVPHIYRGHELRFMLNHAQSKLYVIQSDFRGFSFIDMARNLRVEAPALEHIVTIGAQHDDTLDFDQVFLGTPRELEPGARKRLDAMRPKADDPAFLMFTSGTTGQPKAALHSFNTVWSAGRGITEGVEAGPDDVCFMASTVGHLTGFYWGTVFPLSIGQKIVYQDVWDAAALLDMVEREGVSWTVSATPFVLDMVKEQQRQPRPLASLRAFACGGAPIPPTAAIAAKDVLDMDLVSLWGMTEVGTCTVHHVGVPVETLAASDGMQVDFMDLRIVDDEFNPVADGEEGRLQVRGPSIILGYYEQPDNTAAAETPNGWFETGDLGMHVPDGGVRITGRSKDIILRGGQNVPVVEIENALITHPHIAEVAVVAYPDDRMGERGCAVIVPEGEAPTLADLQEHLSAAGLAKQFWPEMIKIVDAMPRTPSGKIQKFILRDQVKSEVTAS